MIDEAALDASQDPSWQIRDISGLLTESQRQSLEEDADALAAQYGCCVYVLTVDTMNGMARRDFAKQYYQSNDLGSGDWKNGILFLVAMDTREYVTITYGRDPNNPGEYGTGIKAFTDYGIAKLENNVVPKLSDGDYYEAFRTYVDTCGKYLKLESEGNPFDRDSDRSILIPLLITILVPLAIALVVCLIFRAQMKTAVSATQANDYIPSDGFRLTNQQDHYTHTTVTRRTIERDHDSGGGGSSVDSGGFGGSSGGHF